MRINGAAKRADRRYLIVPSENRTREFDAKLLLGCIAAEAGYRVIVGSRSAIHFSIDQLPPAIYVAKDLRASSARIFDILDKLGHTIVAWDEEALVYYTPEHYYAARVFPSAFRTTRALFAWGNDNAELWRRNAAYHGAPIYVAGNPRIDLLRPELLPFFADEANRLKQTYGDMILVNSNFASVNHFAPGGAELARSRISGDKALAFYDGAMEYRTRLLEEFLTMVPALARAFPHATIVVRPHPSENQDLWKQRASQCANVMVLHEGNIAPWLIAARAVVHNGCTTAIEAGLIGKASIAYQPISSETYDIHRPNQVSHRVTSLEALCGAISGSWESGLPIDSALFDGYVAPRGNSLYSDRIVDSIQDLEHAGALDPHVGLYTRFVGRMRAARRRKRKQKARAKREHIARYDAHRFEPLTVSEVQTIIQRLSRCLNRFDRIEVTELKPDIFCLSAPARETAA